VWVGACTVALDLLIVPLFDANGAAAVMVIIRILAIALFTLRLRRAAGVSTPPPPVGVVVAALLAAGVGDRVAGWGLLPALGVASLVFGAVALASRAVRMSDLRDLRAAWAQPPT
jgi:hypothetical protein